MISVLINQAGSTPVQDKKVRQIISSFLRKKKIDDVEVSLEFVDKQEMQALNKKYRGIDKPTTVLTFSQQDLKILGDIVICLEEAKKQGLTLEQLLIHGLKNLVKINEQRPSFLSQISSSKNLRT